MTCRRELTVSCADWAEVPGLVHGTTTRLALPEPGKLDFFDAVERARGVGAVPEWPAVGADQVHGAHLEVIAELDGLRARGVRRNEGADAYEFPETDALIALAPGVLLVIQTADCLPVLLVDAERRRVGLAHCGWRGLLAGLAEKTARAMIEAGSRPAALRAWLGPCAGAARYEVGCELVDRFRRAFAEIDPAVISSEGTHLDLAAIARERLIGAGVEAGNILASGECTLTDRARYHSYRAEGERAGRMLSFIGFEASAAR